MESDWLSYVPFAHWIVCAARPRLLVELGTGRGVSYSAFCEAVARKRLATLCLAIDIWGGDADTRTGCGETSEEFLELHEKRYAFSTVFRRSSDQALGYIEDASIDVLHIDCQDAFTAERFDFARWLPKLSDRGVILLHGIAYRGNEAGMSRLWREIRDQYPAFEFGVCRGLGVLAVGGAVPRAVQELFSLRDPGQIAALRDRLAALGARWQVEADKRVLSDRLSEQAARAIGMEYARVDAAYRAAKTSRRLERLEAKLAVAERARRDAESERAQLRTRYDAVVSSISWRASGPLWWLARVVRLGLRHLERLMRRSLVLPMRSLLGRRKRKPAPAETSQDRRPTALGPTGGAASETEAARTAPPTASESLNLRFGSLEPLRTIPEARSGRRVTVVTDSINPGLLYGGVGTAILMGALLAQRMGAKLRLVTRHHEADPRRLDDVLGAFDVPYRPNVECVFSPPTAGPDVPVCAGDLSSRRRGGPPGRS